MIGTLLANHYRIDAKFSEGSLMIPSKLHFTQLVSTGLAHRYKTVVYFASSLRQETHEYSVLARVLRLSGT